MEIFYDDLTGRWYAHQSVEVNQPSATSLEKRAFVDLGVVNILTVWIEGDRQPISFSGKPLLADWWYWTKKIIDSYKSKQTLHDKENSKTLQKKTA